MSAVSVPLEIFRGKCDRCVLDRRLVLGALHTGRLYGRLLPVHERTCVPTISTIS